MCDADLMPADLMAATSAPARSPGEMHKLAPRSIASRQSVADHELAAMGRWRRQGLVRSQS